MCFGDFYNRRILFVIARLSGTKLIPAERNNKLSQCKIRMRDSIIALFKLLILFLIRYFNAPGGFLQVRSRMSCLAFGNQPASPAESSSNLSQRKIRMRDSMLFV
jgi:hypothetical protein